MLGLSLDRHSQCAGHDQTGPTRHNGAGMPTASSTTVAILCGGRGTRLQEHTHEIPKPLVEIGGRPILWHVMEIYACQGFRRFVLPVGYKGEMIEAFVAEYDWPEGTEIVCVPTG